MRLLRDGVELSAQRDAIIGTLAYRRILPPLAIQNIGTQKLGDKPLARCDAGAHLNILKVVRLSDAGSPFPVR